MNRHGGVAQHRLRPSRRHDDPAGGIFFQRIAQMPEMALRLLLLDLQVGDRGAQLRRSEEHTSELQSLMRISYAVFCLKKKKYTKQTHTKSKRLYTIQ